MKKPATNHATERNLGATVLAAAFAILTGMFAVMSFAPTIEGILVSVVLGLIALLATIVAIYGRTQSLKNLLHSLWYFPF